MATTSLMYGQSSSSGEQIAAALATAKAAVMRMPVTAGVKTTSIPRVTPQGAPPYTGLEVTGVSIGYQDPIAPAFNCGAGAVFHACIPTPQSRMFVGDPATCLVQSSSDTYTGHCGVAFVLVKLGGGNVGGFNTGLIPNGCVAGATTMTWINTTLPNSTGDHVIVGVTFGPGGVMDQWYNYIRILSPSAAVR